jgi:3,4-dihydroxy-9,10-secoandrosta-1,3,5(10)-triene-9,17-dione 4,5-dioxygenase
MTEVTSLGYVVITAEDLDAWSGFAREVLGLAEGSQPSPAPDVETLYLRTDDRSWRLAVERGANGGLAALGFEVRDKESLQSLRAKLEQAGFAVKDAPELAASRRVLGLLQVADPSGLPLEFFYGAKGDKASFVSPTGARFLTGDQGVGHGVIVVTDVDETYNFYINLLGFRLSDVIAFGPAKLQFSSPNPRHHSLAFAGFPGMPPGLQHIMLEVDSVDTVGRALDRVYDNGTPLQSGLGRHTNDHMLSFYCISPSGLPIEYGFGGRQIDNATHTTGYYDAASYWGHRPPDGTDPMRAAQAAAQSAD